MNFLKFTSNVESARLSYPIKTTGLTAPMPTVISATSPIIKNAAIEKTIAIQTFHDKLFEQTNHCAD